jgi:hypothetical protein
LRSLPPLEREGVPDRCLSDSVVLCATAFAIWIAFLILDASELGATMPRELGDVDGRELLAQLTWADPDRLPLRRAALLLVLERAAAQDRRMPAPAPVDTGRSS